MRKIAPFEMTLLTYLGSLETRSRSAEDVSLPCPSVPDRLGDGVLFSIDFFLSLVLDRFA